MTDHAPADMMPAVVKTGPGPENVELRRVPVPQAGPNHLRLRVQATGICGTDLHIAADEYAHEAPVVMGHEICGVVDQVGEGADAGLLGALVALETYFSVCGVCRWCRAGRINLCPARRSLGSFEGGGFAPFVVAPASNAHRLPASVHGPVAALSEPLACVCQCLLDPAVVDAGDRVLVTGPGAMGQLSAQVAKACGGAVTLAGLPRDADRLAIAAGLGIATTTEAPPTDEFDVVIESSGSAAGAGVALRSARRGGRYVQVGIFGRPVEIPFDVVLYKELTVTSGFASTPTSWGRAMALLEAGAVTLAPLVTRQVPLADWRDAFADVRAGVGVKTVLVPHPGAQAGQ